MDNKNDDNNDNNNYNNNNNNNNNNDNNNNDKTANNTNGNNATEGGSRSVALPRCCVAMVGALCLRVALVGVLVAALCFCVLGACGLGLVLAARRVASCFLV